MNNTSAKALFGISVDNRRYTTAETTHALINLPFHYSEILFFIADDIQLYNKATQINKGKSLKEIVKSFNIKNSYYQQREKWLSSLKDKVTDVFPKPNWTFLNVSKIADQHLHKIYRNVLISFQSLDEFNSDVIQTALTHASKTGVTQSRFDTNLSIAYILEEIAINIRLRVFEKILDEFYLGELPLPLMKLYQNKYPIDVFTLAGLETENVEFNFYFSNSIESTPFWIKYT